MVLVVLVLGYWEQCLRSSWAADQHLLPLKFQQISRTNDLRYDFVIGTAWTAIKHSGGAGETTPQKTHTQFKYRWLFLLAFFLF